jgi:hypothetical protein
MRHAINDLVCRLIGHIPQHPFKFQDHRLGRSSDNASQIRRSSSTMKTMGSCGFTQRPLEIACVVDRYGQFKRVTSVHLSVRPKPPSHDAIYWRCATPQASVHHTLVSGPGTSCSTIAAPTDTDVPTDTIVQ